MPKGDPLSASGFPHSREHNESQDQKDHEASGRIMGQSCCKRSDRLLLGHRRHGHQGARICCARRSIAAHLSLSQSKRSTRALIWLLPLIALAMAGCSFDGSFRYDCQNPEIFTDIKAHPECHKPLCDASGICTEDLLGAEIYKRIMDQVDGQKG